MLDMRDVYVVGVGMIRFGRYPERNIGSLGGQAMSLALNDAGLSLRQIEVLVSGNFYETSASGQCILREVGATGVPVYHVGNACAPGPNAFHQAVSAVGSGAYDIAMVVGTEQMRRIGPLGASGERSTSPARMLGTPLMAGVSGLAAIEHMRKYGTTAAQFAKVSVKNHHHAMFNPLSQYQVELNLDEVLSGRTVAYPNTLYMCCPTGSGAAAAILCSAEKARQLTGGAKMVQVAASAHTTAPRTSQRLILPNFNTMTRECARQAYEQAGLGPGDLDSVELHDCCATAEILHYEDLMLCGEGEAARMIDEGRTSLGGDIPVNTSGGLLSKGHPIGATGVANVCEVVWQLRGQAGRRQVEGHKVGMVHTIDPGPVCAIHILVA